MPVSAGNGVDCGKKKEDEKRIILFFFFFGDLTYTTEFQGRIEP
jgi:hypothetical protein